MTSKLPVTIVGGYLGAGKTTLLNALLRGSHGVRLAVIVNDFGSINIDAALMANRRGETLELTNGCVCCSIGSSLAPTLHDLAAREERPEHIIIEASGVADLRRVASLGASHPRLRLDSIVVVTDAETIRTLCDDRYVGDLVRRQLAAADIIVLSKTDLIDDDAQRAVRTWLSGDVPDARVLDGRDGGPIAALILAGCTTHRWPDAPGDPHREQHTDMFSTWYFDADRPLDGDRLRTAIAALPPSVIRAKGILTLAEAPDRRFVLQLVGRRRSIEPELQDFDPRQWRAGRSSIVCIGLAGTLHAQCLDALFAGVA